MALDILTAAALFSSAAAGSLVTGAIMSRRTSELSYRVACLRGTLALVLSGLKNKEARWHLGRTIEHVLELTDEDEAIGDFTVPPVMPVHVVGDTNNASR